MLKEDITFRNLFFQKIKKICIDHSKIFSTLGECARVCFASASKKRKKAILYPNAV